MSEISQHLEKTIENSQAIARLETRLDEGMKSVHKSLNKIDKKLDILNDVDTKMAAHGMTPGDEDLNRKLFEFGRVVARFVPGRKMFAAIFAAVAGALLWVFGGN